VIGSGEGRGGFDGVDPNDGAAQALFVGADPGGEVGQRRLVAKLAAELLAGGLELTALPAHAPRPGVLAQRVDHRASDTPLGESLELDAPILVEAIRRVDQPNHAVLHEVSDVDRMRHRRCHAASQGLDERKTGNDSLTGRWNGERHLVSLIAGESQTAAPLSQPQYQQSR
jgi:hypothetical protein